MELYKTVAQKKPLHLVKYVEWDVHERTIVFNKHTREFIGYSDPGKINNVLADHEQQLNLSETTPRPLGKYMLMFTVRGLFTSLIFPCMQFPAASTKGSYIFPLIYQVLNIYLSWVFVLLVLLVMEPV